MRAMIYDIEIKKGIVKRGEEPIPGIEYCGGWRDFAGMGVSVVGAAIVSASAPVQYRVFMDDNVDEMLTEMRGVDLLVGFNNDAFDDPALIAAYPDFADLTVPRYDLLREIWRAAGLRDTWGGAQSHGGYGLDAVCRANFDFGKTGNGAMAPVDWQCGRVGNVVDYCLVDVWLTTWLYMTATWGDPIKCPRTGRELRLRDPWVVAGKWTPSSERPSPERPDVVQAPTPEEPSAGITFPPDELPEPQYYDFRNLAVDFQHEPWSDAVLVAVMSGDDEAVPKTRVSVKLWLEEFGPAIERQDAEKLIRGLRDERARQGLNRFRNEESGRG